MGRDTFEMRDSMHELTDGDVRKKQPGCNISVPMGFVLLMLALILSIGVALVVYFSTGYNKQVECPTSAPQAVGPGGQIGQNPNGVWWPDKECITSCISKGICSDKGSTQSVTAAPTTMPTTSKPASKGKVRDVRLPDTLIPVSYDVEMRPDIYKDDPKDFTNTGTVSVVMECNRTTKLVTIHSNKLTITKYSLTREDDGTEISIRSVPVYDTDRQFVNFTTSIDLVKGKHYRLTLDYSGPLKNDLAGLYYSSYDETNNVTNVTEKRYIATTQYQATDARKAFPCFDEPALKATFNVSLWRKQHYVALANMPLASNSTPTSDGWVKDTFETTVKMSTYLLAMIVCDFTYKEETTSGGTKFKVWSRKSAIDQVPYALDQGVKILTYFEDFFNESFPLPKTDMIAIPDFAAGAMENWGLITYRETALLYDPKVSAASNKQRVATVVSHELAHQWFGNLVSPSWWDDLWLNEGFASYVEYIGVNHTEPDWDMMDQFVTVDVHSTLRADSLATSHPIYVEVQHPDEINEIFDSISYGKGGSLIRMMRYFLGDSVFQQALSNYIDNKGYKAAHHTDLWKAMQEVADQHGLKDDRGKALDIRGILDTWILQMGYPVLDVQANPTKAGDKQSLTITQSHFLQDDSQVPDRKYPSPYGYTWDVPFSVVTSKDSNFDVDQTSVQWFFRTEKSRTIEVATNAKWLIINPKQYGFYRVNYPETYWQKLIEQQKLDHEVIDPLNRAQIIDDAFNLALAGKLRITYAMELTKYLTKEKSYFPWSSAITSLSYVSSALQSTEAYGDFKKYYKTIITPFYAANSRSWVFNSDEPIIDQYIQSSAIGRACAYDVGDCRKRSKELLTQWMNTGINNIHPNVRSTVYCHGIKQGGEAEWDFIYKKFKTENVAGEAVKLLRSLGCTEELWLLQRLLDYAVDDDKVRKQDSYMAVGAVSSNTLGRYLAWNWLRANWVPLSEKYGVGIMMLGDFVDATTKFFTQYQYEQIEAFTAQQKDLGSATRAFAQAKERAQSNIKYLQRNQKALADWLKDNAP